MSQLIQHNKEMNQKYIWFSLHKECSVLSTSDDRMKGYKAVWNVYIYYFGWIGRTLKFKSRLAFVGMLLWHPFAEWHDYALCNVGIVVSVSHLDLWPPLTALPIQRETLCACHPGVKCSDETPCLELMSSDKRVGSCTRQTVIPVPIMTPDLPIQCAVSPGQADLTGSTPSVIAGFVL